MQEKNYNLRLEVVENVHVIIYTLHISAMFVELLHTFHVAIVSCWVGSCSTITNYTFHTSTIFQQLSENFQLAIMNC
jgi:hypothetical protein